MSIARHSVQSNSDMVFPSFIICWCVFPTFTLNKYVREGEPSKKLEFTMLGGNGFATITTKLFLRNFNNPIVYYWSIVKLIVLLTKAQYCGCNMNLNQHHQNIQDRTIWFNIKLIILICSLAAKYADSVDLKSGLQNNRV